MNDTNSTENESAVEEGKFPERQAYNKSGWLVTFSSPEYRNIAIKKGTHFMKDPTHGKGGPNSRSNTQVRQEPPVEQKPQQEPETDPDLPTWDDEIDTDARLKKMLGAKYKSVHFPDDPSEEPKSQQQKPNAPVPSPDLEKKEPVDSEKQQRSVNIDNSKKFASDKGWIPTPYGDWRDKDGNTVAVTSMSGEVVPISSTFREELKTSLAEAASRLISDILMEWSIRSPDGLASGHDTEENMKILSTILRENGLEDSLEEGKHPDRQAFNKEGWLVTFPSKEYRDAAIKKGTHSISDPTHGKGGMNLYYKRKGKQKRQTQQAMTQTQATEKPAAPNASQPEAGAVANARETTPAAAGGNDAAPTTSPSSGKAPAAPAKVPAASEKTPMPPEKTQATSEPSVSTEPTSTGSPAIDVPVVTTPPEEYASISKKFAAKKGWMAQPYGEYRDAQGNTVAVVGLSGEVVPVKSNDREEYKLFAEKSKV
jgi:hypothetical protein